MVLSSERKKIQNISFRLQVSSKEKIGNKSKINFKEVVGADLASALCWTDASAGCKYSNEQ